MKCGNYIYLLIKENFVKIGFTTNLSSRLNSYKAHDPTITKFCDVVEGKEVLEKIIHETFFDANPNFEQLDSTEWYLCKNEELLESIKKEKINFIIKQVTEEQNKRNTGSYEYIKNLFKDSVFDNPDTFKKELDKVFVKRELRTLDNRMNFLMDFLTDLIKENRKLKEEVGSLDSTWNFGSFELKR